MASVQFTWSDMWLQWYAEQVNDEVKNEFLEQVELEGLIKKVSPKVQLEILEFAPVEVKALVQDSIHAKFKDKILWNIDEYVPSIPWEKIYRELSEKENWNNEASKSM